MNAKEKEARIKELTKEIAELEFKLGGLREELARLQRVAGDTTPLSGLDMLWQTALPKSRERSSREQCRKEWVKIPVGARPKIADAVEALKAWNKSEQWTKDAGAYAKGLHLFIKHRMWEDLPQVRDPLAKYRGPKPPAPTIKPEEIASMEDFSAILGHLTKRVSNPDDQQ